MTPVANRAMLAGMADKTVPVTVTMRVKCECGHAEERIYEFDMPADGAVSREESVPGTCPECRELIRIHLRRTNAR